VRDRAVTAGGYVDDRLAIQTVSQRAAHGRVAEVGRADVEAHVAHQVTRGFRQHPVRVVLEGGQVGAVDTGVVHFTGQHGVGLVGRALDEAHDDAVQARRAAP